MRFIKQNYKKIGVAVLIVLLTVSAVVNIRMMSSDEAKEVAALGSYERFKESEGDEGTATLGEASNDLSSDGNSSSGYSDLESSASPQTAKSKSASSKKNNSGNSANKKTSASSEVKGNRLQSAATFDKNGNLITGTSVKNTQNVKTTTKTSNRVTSGNTGAKTSSTIGTATGTKTSGTAFKPTESSQTGERTKLKSFIGEAWNHTGDRYVYILYQEPDYSKEITVTVQVDYLSIFEDGVECNDDRFAYLLDTDGYILHPTQITCYKGENCWDAIARALIANDIQYTCDAEPFLHGYTIDNKFGTCYLTCCGNIYTGVNTENQPGPFGTSMSGWTYTVTNAAGKTVYPGLGMNGVLIKDGDTLCLKYHNGLDAFTMDEYGAF